MKKVFFGFLFLATVIFPRVALAECCKCLGDDPKTTICIKTTISKSCGVIKSQTSNPDVKSLDCTTLADSSCKQISQDGLCTVGPVDEQSYSAKAAPELTPSSETIDQIQLNTPIPGLTFASQLFQRGKALEIPFFAQYISAVYGYVLIVSVIAAAIAVIYGGFLYIVAATGAKVRSGKEIIRDAIIGLILVFSAYTILAVINPNLLNLKPIVIERIDPNEVGNYSPAIRPTQDKNAPAALQEASSVSTPSSGGSAKLDPKLVAIATQHGLHVDDGIFDDLIKGAKLAGLDACIMLANCDHETRFIPSWQGWYVGSPKEKATHFGACGMTAGYLAPGGPYYDRLRKQFSDFPDLPSGSLTKENRLRIGDWLMTNHVGDAYAASLMMLDNFKILKNEVQGVAAFKAGVTSLQKNAAAMNCTPVQGLKFKDALSTQQQSLKDSCIPHFVAISSLGDPPKGCPEDKYLCTNPTAGQNSSWVGHCSDGRVCYAMLADESVTFIMDDYPKMKQAFPSCN